MLVTRAPKSHPHHKVLRVLAEGIKGDPSDLKDRLVFPDFTQVMSNIHSVVNQLKVSLGNQEHGLDARSFHENIVDCCRGWYTHQASWYLYVHRISKSS